MLMQLSEEFSDSKEYLMKFSELNLEIKINQLRFFDLFWNDFRLCTNIKKMCHNYKKMISY